MFLPMIFVCMTLVDAERDMWLYNAEINADAIASSLELQAVCKGDDVCSGKPLRCTLVTSYSVDSPMCWDRDGDMGCMETQFIDVPVVDIECSNVLNCSPFATPVRDIDLSFDYIPEPRECCQFITKEGG